MRASTRVCGCTPSTAEITSTAPSSTPRARSTSATKSLCPGVSIRFTRRGAITPGEPGGAGDTGARDRGADTGEPETRERETPEPETGEPGTVKAATAERIVMPRLRSMSPVSVWVVPESTLPSRSMTPVS